MGCLNPAGYDELPRRPQWNPDCDCGAVSHASPSNLTPSLRDCGLIKAVFESDGEGNRIPKRKLLTLNTGRARVGSRFVEDKHGVGLVGGLGTYDDDGDDASGDKTNTIASSLISRPAGPRERGRSRLPYGDMLVPRRVASGVGSRHIAHGRRALELASGLVVYCEP